ncbi:MAG: M81 family metallopeptidase [Caldilineaceae bacterium SB0670_bin_27]|uniref:M81 family metallopeptidase n=1 Tax=Caldilineaceae bacterium SB0664_bin_27 TaxID=2605260 RepID=A0A6B0Z069_9CHLR|nr:M81 family metallopeptidase [Caldilineaceae bacterium SB0664_bin_27]MYJ77468.1 M81 family metallopeptidase [Caldilineaceae bacterium SB0670_bin_27]
MAMRIGIASLNHESNTFASFPTTLSDFRFVRGQEIIEQYRPTFHELGGFIAGADEYGYEMVPLMGAVATPAGAVEAEAYETLTDELLGLIRDAMPLDGLLLGLHGAFVAEGFPQGDGETTRRVRELVGPDFPVVVTHDYHGNVPPQLVEDATALIIYKTCPHIDQRERGLQAAELITRTVRGEVRPVSSIAKPELVYNIAFHNTNMHPMKPVMDAAIELEAQPGIQATSVAAGYQYADVPWMGPCIVVVADGDQELADREAQRLADLMWSLRDELLPAIPKPAEAVKMSIASEEKPVSMMEMGDNIGGGSAGDSTFVLEELLGQGANGWVVALYDPEAAAACAAAGIGAHVTLPVGGKVDDEHGPTLRVEGTVRTLHDGKFIETEVRHGGGRNWDQGLTAVLETSGGLLVLDSLRTPPMSFNQLRSVGIMPEQHEIFVAKGSVAPRAAYEPVSARIIEVDSGGATSISRPPEEFQLARKGLYEWTQAG